MTEHDFDRTVRAWLEDGPSTMSDRPLEAALAEIHVTHQRRVLWPARRFPVMFNVARFATAAAAVAIAAVIGLSLLPGGGFGGPGPTPSPSPTPRLVSGDVDGYMQLEAGRYITDPAFEVPVTFSVPAGLEGTVGGPYLAELAWSDSKAIAITFGIFRDVYADPCFPGLGFVSPPVGPTVDDLAAALTSMPGVTATAPVDVTIDGHSGKQLTLTAPADFTGCSIANGYSIWAFPLGAVKTMVPAETTRVWILDVDGERLVIDVPEPPGYTDASRAEVRAILDSLDLGTPD